MPKTWFITGASSGFGHAWTQAALERGDRVAATVRGLPALDELAARFPETLLPLELDVHGRDAVREALHRAHEHFGRLDVVASNAGYGHNGFVEEATEEEARAQMETNFFGSLWVAQAAVPVLRAQGSGHLIQLSSIMGILSAPTMGLYAASKWAVEGLFDALSGEVAGFGIKTTLLEPGGYATQFLGTSARASEPNPAYQGLRDQMAAGMPDGMPIFPAPERTVPALMALVDSDQPPTRLILSSLAFDAINAVYEQRLAGWREWESVSRSADDA